LGLIASAGLSSSFTISSSLPELQHGAERLSVPGLEHGDQAEIVMVERLPRRGTRDGFRHPVEGRTPPPLHSLTLVRAVSLSINP